MGATILVSKVSQRDLPFSLGRYHLLRVAKKFPSLVHSEHEVDHWTPSQGFVEYWLIVELSGPSAGLDALPYACLYEVVSAHLGPSQVIGWAITD